MKKIQQTEGLLAELGTLVNNTKSAAQLINRPIGAQA